MNTDKSTQPTTSVPVAKPGKEVTNQQLMSKLLELEKKIDAIEHKLETPLIS
jgi:hypothetical protein